MNEYLDWLEDNLIDPECNEQLNDKEDLDDETILADSTNR